MIENYILNIETSTKACSVSISNDGVLLAVKESVDMDYSHAEKLNLFIDEVIKSASLEFKQLKAIAVSKGPGSYTGLRIGVSTAKGLAYALQIPLISIDTLGSMANGFLMNSKCLKSEILVPMIDARRKEVYMRIFDFELKSLSETEAKVIDVNSFDKWSSYNSIHLFGDGADKFHDDFINDDRVVIHKKFYPSAEFMVALSYQKFKENNFEDVAYFEPFYLKDFIAIKPRKLF